MQKNKAFLPGSTVSAARLEWVGSWDCPLPRLADCFVERKRLIPQGLSVHDIISRFQRLAHEHSAVEPAIGRVTHPTVALGFTGSIRVMKARSVFPRFLGVNFTILLTVMSTFVLADAPPDYDRFRLLLLSCGAGWGGMLINDHGHAAAGQQLCSCFWTRRVGHPRFLTGSIHELTN